MSCLTQTLVSPASPDTRSQAGRPPQPAARSANLDFVKGVLVLVMVVYHTMDYFALGKPGLYTYIKFVSGAFIFISGFVVARYYASKYRADPRKTTLRLIGRGFKLVAIFTLINGLVHLLGVRNFNKVQFGMDEFLSNALVIYTVGNAKLTSFEVLLPIGYLLILSPLFLRLDAYRYWVAAGVGLGLVGMSLARFPLNNLSLLVIGLSGLALGALPALWVGGRWLPAMVASLALIVYYLILDYIPRGPATYLVNIVLNLGVIYGISTFLPLAREPGRTVAVFGQYSLLLYLAQIIFLQLLFRGFIRQRWELGWQIAAIVLGTSGFLVATCYATAWLRKKSSRLDAIYRFALG